MRVYVLAHPDVALVVDDYAEDWTRLVVCQKDVAKS